MNAKEKRIFVLKFPESRDGSNGGNNSLLKKTSQPVSNMKQKKLSTTTHSGKGSLSYPKKDREAFRQALVGIIM